MTREEPRMEWMRPTGLLSGFVRAPVSVLLRSEGAVIMVAAIIAYGHFGGGVVFFLATFLVPDLSMLGYLLNARVGAIAYNSAHTYILPVMMISVGLWVGVPILVVLSAVWMAHIGFDRLLGYGLKYSDHFGHTHLGLVGKLRETAAGE